jgi:hypothetical protein
MGGVGAVPFAPMRYLPFALILAACGAAPASPPDAATDTVPADTTPVDVPATPPADVVSSADVDVAEISSDAPAPADVVGDVRDATDVTSDTPPDLSCAPDDTICGGRCVNLGVDADNCGACGVVCTSTGAPPNTHPICRTSCTFSCDAGYYNCNAVMSDGCEVHDPSGSIVDAGRCRP